MDIHRCRFIPYPASPINALAFSHTLTPRQKSPQDLRLAIGRANGDIEIWNPARGIWSQETVFHGGKNRSVEGLVWTQDLDEQIDSGSNPGKLRLFSIGHANSITEWNLATGMPLRHSSGSNAEIWSLAAQPRWEQEDGPRTKAEQLLAVGCGDGSVVLQSIAESDFIYVRALRRPQGSKARVLSLAFCGRTTIAAGYSDGTITIFDTLGKTKSTMHLGTGPTKANTYVWALRYLSDSVLVSGDSTGELKFWNLKTRTLTQRLVPHDADILTIAHNADGTQLFSAGMDRKICVIAKDKKTRRWKTITQQRIHTGQVKSMATIDSKDLNVVVSGGIDAAPTVVPLGSFGKQFTRMLPGLPQSPPIISAPKDRLLVSWWDREVAFCELNQEMLQQLSIQDQPDAEVDPLQRILVQGEENISSVSVTPDGKLLAIATNSSCKVFLLTRRKDKSLTRRIRQLNLEHLTNQGARSLQFSPNGQWLLIVQPDNVLKLYQFQVDDTSKTGYAVGKSARTLGRNIQSISGSLTTLGQYLQTISSLAWSPDSNILACADVSGSIDVWTLNQVHALPNGKLANGRSHSHEHSLSDSEDSDDEIIDQTDFDNGLSWRRLEGRIPRPKATPLILSFRPYYGTIDSMKDRLVVVTAQHELLEFHARTGKLTDWSRRNPSSQLPAAFAKIRDRVMGCVWDVTNRKSRLWLYGSTFLFMFDLNKDLSGDNKYNDTANLKRKRSNLGGKQGSKNFGGAGDNAKNPIDFGLQNRARSTRAKTDIKMKDEDEESSSDDENAEISLVALRRQQSEKHINGTSSTEDETADSEANKAAEGNSRKEVSYWFTHKYRSILGLVPLGSFDDAENDNDLEVGLVERPLWNQDLDVPFLA